MGCVPGAHANPPAKDFAPLAREASFHSCCLSDKGVGIAFLDVHQANYLFILKRINALNLEGGSPIRVKAKVTKGHFMTKQSDVFVLMTLLRNWKKPIIIISLGLTVGLVLLIGGLSYAAFSVGSAMWSKGSEVVKTLSVAEQTQDLGSTHAGLTKVQEFSLELGKTWLLQQASAGQFHVMWKGISCLQAAGGPGPAQVAVYLDPFLNEHLRSEMNKTLEARTEIPSTWAACVKLLLPS